MLKHRRTPQAAKARVERWPHDDLDPSKACENHYEDTQAVGASSAVKQVVEEVVCKFPGHLRGQWLRIPWIDGAAVAWTKIGDSVHGYDQQLESRRVKLRRHVLLDRSCHACQHVSSRTVKDAGAVADVTPIKRARIQHLADATRPHRGAIALLTAVVRQRERREHQCQGRRLRRACGSRLRNRHSSFFDVNPQSAQRHTPDTYIGRK